MTPLPSLLKNYPDRKLFCLCGPSGAGKTSLIKASVPDRSLGVCPTISHTTRKPRNGENTTDYNFVDGIDFSHLKQAGMFLECEEIHGNWYGTSIQTLEFNFKREMNCIMHIDYRGALNIRKLAEEEAARVCLIFVIPASWRSLRRRLVARGDVSPVDLETRMLTAVTEVQAIPQFDYVIVNATSKLDEAVAALRSVLTQDPSSEHLRPAKFKVLSPSVAADFGLL